MVTTLTSYNCWGTSSFSQMCASSLCSCSARAVLDFHISAGMPSGPGALLDFMAWIAAWTSWSVKGFARCSWIGSWCTLASDSKDTFEGRFSRFLKYSFNLYLIQALSVSRVEPSSLRGVDAADVLGPNTVFELLDSS